MYKVKQAAGDCEIVKGEMVFEVQEVLAGGLAQRTAERLCRELNGTGTIEVIAGHGPFTEAHSLLIARVRQLKDSIYAHLECGDRDFKKLADMVASYADAQGTADQISGQA